MVLTNPSNILIIPEYSNSLFNKLFCTYHIYNVCLTSFHFYTLFCCLVIYLASTVTLNSWVGHARKWNLIKGQITHQNSIVFLIVFPNHIVFLKISYPFLGSDLSPLLLWCMDCSLFLKQEPGNWNHSNFDWLKITSRWS